MLTDLQKQKITHYFRVVMDQDRNGVLEENDFREIGESLCILWRHKPGTTEYEQVMNQCRQSWRLFENYFSKHGGQADLEHFLHFFDEMLSPGGEELYKKYILNMVSNTFDQFDLNNDGIISINEYVDMFMCYHIPIKSSANAFVKLDRNGDDAVSKKELLQAVNEFFKSNNPKAAGNWLFGFWGDKDD